MHVAKALLVDQLNTEGFTLWLHLNKEEGGLPLTKTLEAQTELAPAQYQFKHLSFQEGLFAQHLLMQADEGIPDARLLVAHRQHDHEVVAEFVRDAPGKGF